MIYEDFEDFGAQSLQDGSSAPKADLEAQKRTEHVNEPNEESDGKPSVEVSTSKGHIYKLRIFLLVYMFFLQGIPTGISTSLPLILISNNVSYSDLGTFSLMLWPMSLRILWAPLIDSLYISKFGRRRTWIIPSTLVIGVIMFSASGYIQSIVYRGHSNSTEILYLTIIFFIMTTLASAQSVAIDGWTLSALQTSENLPWIGFCKKIGLTIGKHYSYQIFLILESKDISNRVIRPFFGLDSQSLGIWSVGRFFRITGVIHIITAMLFLMFLPEKASEQQTKKERLSIVSTYKVVWKILQLKPMQELLIIIVTFSIAFGAEDLYNVTLVKKGVPREYLAVISLAFFPVLSSVSIVITKFIKSSNSLILMYKIYPLKLSILVVMYLWATISPSYFKRADNTFPYTYYVMSYFIYISLGILNCVIIVTVTTFFSKIADIKIGGTYFSLLYTVYNIGVIGSSTTALKLVNYLTFKVPRDMFAETKVLTEPAERPFHIMDKVRKVSSLFVSSEQNNDFQVDGYFILTALFAIFGLIWMIFARKRIKILQNLDKLHWTVVK